MLRKFQPNFQHYVKKIEAQAKRWFSYKKTVYLIFITLRITENQFIVAKARIFPYGPMYRKRHSSYTEIFVGVTLPYRKFVKICCENVNTSIFYSVKHGLTIRIMIFLLNDLLLLVVITIWIYICYWFYYYYEDYQYEDLYFTNLKILFICKYGYRRY